MALGEIPSPRASNGEARSFPRPAFGGAKAVLEGAGQVCLNIGERKEGCLDGRDLTVVLKSLGVKPELGVGVASDDQIPSLHFWVVRDSDECQVDLGEGLAGAPVLEEIRRIAIVAFGGVAELVNDLFEALVGGVELQVFGREGALAEAEHFPVCGDPVEKVRKQQL